MGAELFVLQKYRGQAGARAEMFTDLKELLPRLWQEQRGIICIMATGIVVRLIAPLLQGKDSDPAVVVMDEAGKFAVSLLSGHLGGANELCERCAFVTGARAVITTATDVNGLPSFDVLAREFGWAIEDLSRVKTLNSILLDGEEIAVVDATGLVRSYFHGRGKLVFHDTFVAGLRSNARGFLFVTSSVVPPQLQSPNLLVLRPRNLVLGIGCNSGTEAEEIKAVIMANLKRQFLSPLSIDCIATAEAKRDEPGLVACAASLGAPLFYFPSPELNRVEAPTPPSDHVIKAIGASGVAEPAALLASQGGKLLLKKVKDGNVTLAIAEHA
jgi:cobalt-precorrin 5A hydrolase